jgi:hypothetical protein
MHRTNACRVSLSGLPLLLLGAAGAIANNVPYSIWTDHTNRLGSSIQSMLLMHS